MTKSLLALFALFFVLASSAIGEPRTVTPLPEWSFAPEATPVFRDNLPVPPAQATWRTVAVPHIFRQSGLPDDASGWYRRTFAATTADRGHRFFLRLEGAASVVDVFVNGRHIGGHKSAYTAAVFDLTPAVRYDAPNEILVRVSNRDAEIPGLLARSPLYFVNGGMFRPASLIETGAVHIFPDMGSSGVYLTPVGVSAHQAGLDIGTVVRNPLASPADVVVRHTVTGPDGTTSARFETRQTIPAGATVTVDASTIIASPKLWDLHHPELYSVRTELVVGGVASDEVTETTGFRTIALRNGQFFLNGRVVQLRGVNKHAQTEDAWNAVTDDDLRNDWAGLEDLGVNIVRLAHYPHSPLEYTLADQAGIAVWAENGFAGQKWKGGRADDSVPTPVGDQITREMVRQNWNHPSILFWSCGNETVGATATHYAKIIREEDPTGNHLVTYAVSADKPEGCDFLGTNTYQGWYGGRLSDFGSAPFVSETGAGCWVSQHVPYGSYTWSVSKFEPEEYACLFAEHHLQIVYRDAVASHPLFLWWAYREFYDRKFKNNRNTKGLVTLAGRPKDIYYLFKAFFRSDVPVVHLDDHDFFYRQFAPDNGIKAYANTPSLELFVNGVSQGRLANGAYRLPTDTFKTKSGDVETRPDIRVDNVFYWKASLAPGRNVVEVDDGDGHRDGMIVYQAGDHGPAPAPAADLVQYLVSSNPANPALHIDRPIQPQFPFYTDVDGSSDNTFDRLPPLLADCTWIATRRLSDPALKTDLAFRLNPSSAGATAYVLFSTGSHPTITLKPVDPAVAAAAATMRANLAAAGFKPVPVAIVWRDNLLDLSDAALWSRPLAPGERLSIPGVTLDYVILLKKHPHPEPALPASVADGESARP